MLHYDKKLKYQFQIVHKHIKNVMNLIVNVMKLNQKTIRLYNYVFNNIVMKHQRVKIIKWRKNIMLNIYRFQII